MLLSSSLLGRDADMLADDALSDMPAFTLPGLGANTLPFVVRVVRNESHLQHVCALRAEAYGRRMPAFGESLQRPEAADRAPGTAILMAQDKSSGAVVGTMRIHSNLFETLPIEGAFTFPKSMRGQLLVELCRFSIQPGYNNTAVRLALFKAMYLYCYAHQVQHIWVAARRPLDRIYKSLGFTSPQTEDVWVPLSYADNIPHSILSFDVLAAERLWHDIRHPLYTFMVRTYHPDIQVFSGGSPWGGVPAPR
jgi:hypothetical protein